MSAKNLSQRAHDAIQTHAYDNVINNEKSQHQKVKSMMQRWQHAQEDKITHQIGGYAHTFYKKSTNFQLRKAYHENATTPLNKASTFTFIPTEEKRHVEIIDEGGTVLAY
ncbi:MAG: hypothetical protein M1837_004422, partial [Sclerophora amabilis]